ncbi:4-(cytidine 5'-diphospho)-2-C-methyl-D-erythritol kinase [Helicobacter sp. MIT 05-5294]|uniref:4-(cytidine 5'-diphospho)-2-C-methyl-D-erythritol kinase n=1 Tax=Helicobacter sp. MIT 05-5294 TaxID=1548150 RepID=UPI000B0319B5|nr:4-(cytidine 5'-diphospho)-2-C-methyl-D-erythritol kinase [Helicobacter sp. MIT 05-5294]TLD85588.1 4-(cytidine 5'-diphospho)-2-C-methyl-D-erythritol kinase [Helicobacter sp. MIT 05-5294]
MVPNALAQGNVYLSYAKINLFLKIVGKTCINGTNYHLLESRFMKVPHLYDTLTFEWNAPKFEIVGNFDCALEQNSIYKAYRLLMPYLRESQSQALAHLRILVNKRIPSGGGLGGGSSNAACFLQAIHQIFGLSLDLQTLMNLGAQVGSDVPFFLSGLEIANVRGRGEIVESCNKAQKPDGFAPFEVEIIMPKLHCETAKVYQQYAKFFYNEATIQQNQKQNWLEIPNNEILQKTPQENNDLLVAALALYPKLESYVEQGLFLSGSGSCFWRKKDSTNKKLKSLESQNIESCEGASFEAEKAIRKDLLVESRLSSLALETSEGALSMQSPNAESLGEAR